MLFIGYSYNKTSEHEVGVNMAVARTIKLGAIVLGAPRTIKQRTLKRDMM